jgi:PAS domain S-box-containing protein
MLRIILIFILVMGAAFCIWLAELAWRRIASTMSFIFAALMLAVALYCIGYAFEMDAVTAQGKMNWIRVEYFGVGSIPALWLSLVFFYTNQNEWLKWRRQWILWTIPIITILAVGTNDWHHLFYVSTQLSTGGPFPILLAQKGPLYWLHESYGFIAFFGGAGLLIQEYIHTRSIYRRQIFLMSIASLVTITVIALYLTGAIPIAGFDVNPFAMLFSSLIIAWGVFNVQLIDLTPAARDVLFENSIDAVLVFDDQFRLVDYNATAARTLDIADQRIGESLQKIVPPVLAEGIAGLDETNSVIDVTLNQSEEHIYEVHYIPVSRQRQSNLGCLVVLHDATRRKQVEELIRQNEARYRLLAENSNDVIWTVDPGGHFTYISPSVFEMRGYTVEEAFRQTLEESICSSSLEPIRANIQLAFHEAARGNILPSKTFEIEQPCKDGSSVWTEVTGRMVMDDLGRPVAFMGISRDIRERKCMEKQIQTTMEELVQFNQAMVNREIRMIELKQEVNTLLVKYGFPAKYILPPEE